MASDQPGYLCHRCEPAVGGTPKPAGAELLGRSAIRILPEVPEPFFECPGTPHLEITPQELPKGPPLLQAKVTRAPQPEILRPGQPRVALAPQQTVLDPPHLVDGLMQMLDDMKFIEHDFRFTVGDVGLDGLDVRLPHIHGYRFDALELRRGAGGPERVQTLGLAIVVEEEDPLAIQVRHDG